MIVKNDSVTQPGFSNLDASTSGKSAGPGLCFQNRGLNHELLLRRRRYDSE